MFLKQTITAHGREIVTYTEQGSGAALRLCPALGATVFQIALERQGIVYDLLDEPAGEELAENAWYKGSFLLPFPNRIENGQYRFGNMLYQLPVNEEAHRNAIHGFIDKRPFRVVREETGGRELKLLLTCDYPGDYPGYPFPFRTEIEFRFSNRGGLAIDLKITNTGDGNMPAGIGWHPYYKFDCPADELQVKLPRVSRYNINARYIPDGHMSAFEDFSSLSPIGEKKLDHCFKILAWETRCEVRVRHPSGHPELHLWQEMGDKKYNYLVVFTPPWRKSFAVEPMSCNINAFNSGDGLITLVPGETAGGKFGVQLSGEDSTAG
jgi:aldose 1-epimerase